jgi:hypothetical protein
MASRGRYSPRNAALADTLGTTWRRRLEAASSTLSNLVAFYEDRNEIGNADIVDVAQREVDKLLSEDR